MIFIDSWVWIEFFSKDDKWKKSEEVIAKLQEEKGLVSAIVLMEVKYRVRRKYGRELSDRLIHIIESFDNLTVLPVTSKVAKYAADIRDKYYKRNTKELSYADSIHIATADLVGCDILFSGDTDFEEIDEVETEIIV
ncbi:MAG: type II toxin-antitoxin system VapC family toxin [Thermoplasmatota archaeon]